MVSYERDDPAQVVYSRPESLTDAATHYCPGCTHGVAHRLIAEVLDEMGLREQHDRRGPGGLLGVCLQLFRLSISSQAPHGRAPAMATGIKRVLPDRHRLHLPGRRRPGLDRHGRDHARRGARREHHRHLHQQRHLRHDRRADGPHHPARPEDHLLAQRARCGSDRASPSAPRKCWPRWTAPATSVRRSLHDPKNIRLAKKAIRMAFETQLRGLGFSMVELLSTCPTNWGMTPLAVAEVAGRAHDPLLPAGRLQGRARPLRRSRSREEAEHAN